MCGMKLALLALAGFGAYRFVNKNFEINLRRTTTTTTTHNWFEDQTQRRRRDVDYTIPPTTSSDLYQLDESSVTPAMTLANEKPHSQKIAWNSSIRENIKKSQLILMDRLKEIASHLGGNRSDDRNIKLLDIGSAEDDILKNVQTMIDKLIQPKSFLQQHETHEDVDEKRDGIHYEIKDVTKPKRTNNPLNIIDDISKTNNKEKYIQKKYNTVKNVQYEINEETRRKKEERNVNKSDTVIKLEKMTENGIMLNVLNNLSEFNKVITSTIDKLNYLSDQSYVLTSGQFKPNTDVQADKILNKKNTHYVNYMQRKKRKSVERYENNLGNDKSVNDEEIKKLHKTGEEINAIKSDYIPEMAPYDIYNRLPKRQDKVFYNKFDKSPYKTQKVHNIKNKSYDDHKSMLNYFKYAPFAYVLTTGNDDHNIQNLPKEYIKDTTNDKYNNTQTNKQNENRNVIYNKYENAPYKKSHKTNQSDKSSSKPLETTKSIESFSKATTFKDISSKSHTESTKILHNKIPQYSVTVQLETTTEDEVIEALGDTVPTTELPTTTEGLLIINRPFPCKENWIWNVQDTLAIIPRALIYAATDMQKEPDYVPKHPLDPQLARKTSKFISKIWQNIITLR